MSETEVVKGRLKLVSDNPIDWLLEVGVDVKAYIDGKSWVHCTPDCDEHLGVILYNGSLYKVIKEKDLDPYGYVELSKTTDGYEFIACWYNGGGSLEEALEYALKGLGE